MTTSGTMVWACLLGLGLVAGCGDDAPRRADAGGRDATTPDGAQASDAGEDASPIDAGGKDAGSDAGREGCDDDGDGLIDVECGGEDCDDDGDGVESIACDGEDCDDADDEVFPGADEWGQSEIFAVWTRETGGNPYGIFTDIALDSRGSPHVAHYTSVPLRPQGLVRLGVRDRGGDWSVGTVDNREPWRPRVYVDDSDLVHVGYVDRDANVFRYLTGRFPMSFEGEDAVDLVDYQGVAGAAFRVEADGTPHVLYRTEPEGVVTLATRSDEGEWSSETVPVAEGRGPADLLRLAYGPDGTPFVFHRLSEPRDFAVAWPEGDGWRTEAMGAAGTAPRLAVGGDGTPHVFFVSKTDCGSNCAPEHYLANHARWTGDGWDLRTVPFVDIGVEKVDGLCAYDRMVATDGGMPIAVFGCFETHLVWADEAGLHSKAVTDLHDEGELDTFSGTSLTLGADGEPHVTYMLAEFDGIRLSSASISYNSTDARDLDCDGVAW